MINRFNSYLGGQFEKRLALYEKTLRKKSSINFHNKFYAECYEKGKLDNLSVWLMLFNYYPSKQICFEPDDNNNMMGRLAKKLQMGKSTFQKKIQSLIKDGYITKHQIINDNGSYLLELNSNETLDKKLGVSNTTLFIDINKLKKYSNVKYFLKQIPVFTNIKRQENNRKLHQHFGRLRIRLDNGELLDSGEFKSLKRYEKGQNKLDKNKKCDGTQYANLSLNGICRITGTKSQTTAQRYKKFLKTHKMLHEYRRTEVLMQVESKDHFNYLKFEKKSIPKHALLTKNNKVFIYKSNVMFPLYNQEYLDLMDEYFDLYLYDYVNETITNRNFTRDEIKVANALIEGDKSYNVICNDKKELEQAERLRRMTNYLIDGGDPKEIRIYLTNRTRIGENKFEYDQRLSIPDEVGYFDYDILSIKPGFGVNLKVYDKKIVNDVNSTKEDCPNDDSYSSVFLEDLAEANLSLDFTRF